MSVHPLSACFILADMYVRMLIHNSVTTVAAPSCAFIYTQKGFGAFLKLFHREEIHQAGKTTEEQRSIESAEQTMVAELLSPSCPISHLS